MLCTRSVLQLPPDVEGAHDTEAVTNIHDEPQRCQITEMLKCLEQLHLGCRDCCGAPKALCSRDALSTGASSLLHACLALVALAHDSEHLSRASLVAHAHPQAHSKHAMLGRTSERTQGQQQYSLVGNNSGSQQTRERAQLEAKELRTSVTLLAMQLQGCWPMSHCSTEQTICRAPASNLSDTAQTSLLWKAVASALLHFQTATSAVVRTSRSIPRLTASTTKLPKERDSSQSCLLYTSPSPRD